MVTKISNIYSWLVYIILWGMVWTYPVLAEAMGAMYHVKISDSYKFGGVLMVY